MKPETTQADLLNDVYEALIEARALARRLTSPRGENLLRIIQDLVVEAAEQLEETN